MKLKDFFRRNSSQILTVVGIIGYAGCAILSARAYKTCCERMEIRKKELQADKLPVKEVVKTCALPCLPAAIDFALSTACVVGAQSSLMKKNAGLLVALKGSESALAEVYTQTKAIAGEETYKAIREKVAEKQMTETKVPERLTIEENGNCYLDDNKTLWYDATYGGYFYATPVEVERIFSQKRQVLQGDRFGGGEDFDMGDLYFDLHGEPIGIGDDFEYRAEDYLHQTFDYMDSGDYKTAPNGKPAKCIYYDKAKPKYGFA